MRDADFLHMIRQQALAHGVEWKEALEWMKEPLDIENLKARDEMQVAEEHPYWRGDPEERAKVLKVADGVIELLRAMYPAKESERRASAI
jgi:hypothetical protein